MEYKGRTLRHELKYAIDDAEHLALRSRLQSLMKRDPNVGETGEYRIRSLYFDDYADSSYVDKEAGVFQRGKYRVRIYGESDGLIKLEYKEKFDSYISKTSRTISRDLYDRILRRQVAIGQVKDDPFLMDFYLQMKMTLLSPRVIVEYVREPYIFNSGNVRITFDKHLRASLRDLDVFARDPLMVTPRLPGSMILEVKYDDHIPEFIRSGLHLARSQHLALSKYTICRDVRNALDWKEKSL